MVFLYFIVPHSARVIYYLLTVQNSTCIYLVDYYCFPVFIVFKKRRDFVWRRHLSVGVEASVRAIEVLKHHVDISDIDGYHIDM